MTAQEWFNSRQGQSLLVPGADPADRGQCAQSADYALKEIYNLPYVWANAIDWWGLPQSLAGNFTQVTDGSIKAGDFVIYNQKIGSIYGHVDVALQDGNVNSFIAGDSNWSGNLTLRQISHVGQAGYIIGALRPKGSSGGTMSNIISDQGSADIVYAATLHTNNPASSKTIIGLDYNTALSNIQVTPEWKAQDGVLNTYMPQVLAELGISDPVQAVATIQALKAGQGSVTKQQALDYINQHLG